MAEFEAHLASIVQLIESREYITALSSINDVIDSAPPQQLAECYAIRGFAQLKQLEFQRAEEDCSEAISLDWEKAQTYAWRAAARGEQGKWHLAFDDLDRAYEYGGALQDRFLGLMEAMSLHARDHFRNLATIGELTPDALFERGWMYLRMNKFEKAYVDFNQALKRDAHHAWASVGLAEVFLKRPEFKQLERVGALCDIALAGSPACRRQAWKVRAKFHSQLGDVVNAKNDLRMLAQLAGENVLDLVQCVELMMQLGDHLAAIDLLNHLYSRNPARVLALLKRGDCYSAIWNYSLAILDYTEYLDSFPASVPALVHRAKAHLALQHPTKALADLTHALELEPNDLEANLRISQVYCELEKLDLAMDHARKAVQLDGQQAEPFAVLASIYNRLNDYRQAVEEYSRSIELARTIPDRAQYRFLRGVAAYESADFELAAADLKQATEERPYHAGGWIWKAATSARQEDWAGAILALQQAIQIRPIAAEQYHKMGQPIAEKAIHHYRRLEQRQGTRVTESLYLNRALAYQFLGQHDLAIEDFAKGLTLSPRNRELLIRRGQSLIQTGEWAAAITDFSNELKRNPDDHQALYLRASAHLANQNWTDARVDLGAAIERAPTQPRYRMLLGEIELNDGNALEALTHLDQAILLDPTNPLAYRLRGIIHTQLNHHLQAVRDFSHSLELFPAQPDLLVMRGEAHLKSNQPLTALEDFEAALSQNDRLAKAYAGRATVLMFQQRHEYALIWLTKAMHRFQTPEELAEILLARGKVYYQMARYVPAISDFTLVMELMRSDPDWLAAGRFPRALAKIQSQQFESAAKDLRKLLKHDESHSDYRTVANWLADRSKPTPAILYPPLGNFRPTRPSVKRTGVVLSSGSVSKWRNDPPHNTWIVRADDHKEFGPVPLELLADWAGEGRLVNGMRLLRSDWSKWKRIEKIFPEITPLESMTGLVEEFPELDLKGRSSQNGS